MSTARPDPFSLTVVVPFYNEGAENVGKFFAAVHPVLASLTPTYEVVAVDDGSQDDTADALRKARDADPRVKVLVLSRNYGHQVALTAGINHASGDAVVVMDGDLQDPPSVIEVMVRRWREGLDIVYGRRERREGESLFKRGASALFYRLLWVLGDHRIPKDVGDFRLMDRVVVDALNAFPERNRFLRGLVSWMGFSQGAVTFVRTPRVGGAPKYSLGKLMRLAADGLFSFSRKPLRLATYLGAVCSFSAFCYLAWIVVRGLFFRAEVMFGWYSLASVVLFLGGIQLICLGLIGEYVGRIYEEVKARPLYLVRERRGLDVGASREALPPELGHRGEVNAPARAEASATAAEPAAATEPGPPARSG